MDKITVRTKALSQALFSLAVAGCETAEVSVVAHAVKVEGIKESDERVVLHVWSKDAEATAEAVGSGRKLTEEDCKALDLGICPNCEEREQLHKGPKEGLAIMVSCDKGHLFWVPPAPLEPEYRGMPAVEAIAEQMAAAGEAEAEQAVAISEADLPEMPEEEADVGNAAEEAIRALEEEKPDEASDTK